MADAGEVAKLLNQFRGTGMQDLTSDSDISAVITEYFCQRTHQEDDNSDFSEDEEEAAVLPAPLTPADQPEAGPVQPSAGPSQPSLGSDSDRK